MIIYGYQPVTLIDFPGKVATILFVSGCPLRCQFCHNPDLVLVDKLKNEDKSIEFLEYIKKRQHLLDGVVISGGEPLINNDIMDLLYLIKSYDLKIKIDTSGINASLLERILKSQLVDYIALDFKNIPGMLNVTCGINDSSFLDFFTDQWNESLRILRQYSTKYEIRTTVVKNYHSLNTLLEMASVLLDNEIWYLQPFEKNTKIIADFVNETTPIIDLTQYTELEFLQILSEVRSVHDQTYIR